MQLDRAETRCLDAHEAVRRLRPEELVHGRTQSLLPDFTRTHDPNALVGLVIEQRQTRRDARFEDASYVFLRPLLVGWSALLEDLDVISEHVDERMLAVACDEKGVVGLEVCEEMGHAEGCGLVGVGGGVNGWDARLGAGEEGVGDG